MRNSTIADNNMNVGNTGMDSATLAGVVSTIVAFLALIVSSIQLLYQYYTNVSLNALGARNCNERVMGPWAKFTRRRWRWSELRFETLFESPILFVSTIANRDRGPLLSQKIWYINGSKKSYEETRTPLPDDLCPAYEIDYPPIHHGVNVEASWVSLLRTLQSMERESTEWDDTRRCRTIEEERRPFETRVVAVGVQAQKLSWDFVPNFKKPFANTTMSDMVEMAAMLGIHWTAWDPKADQYRAEGNNCLLLGTRTAELGLVFQFIRRDRSEFRENRIIPHPSIKRLCFGFVPTFYGPHKGYLRSEKSNVFVFGEVTLPFLKLGSRYEIAETLKTIGCSDAVSLHFTRRKSIVEHLFPAIFEVVGMLGQTISIEGKFYRMLPNPTIYRWERQRFDTKRLLLAFKEHLHVLTDLYASSTGIPEPIAAIMLALDRLGPLLKDILTVDYSPTLLNNLHAAIRIVDCYFENFPENRKFSMSEDIILETVSHHISAIVSHFREMEYAPLNLFSWVSDGTNEHNYIALIFRRCRWAATHDDPDPHHTHSPKCAPKRVIVGQSVSVEMPVPGVNTTADRPCSPWKEDARERDITWCLLVFRMLCWLQLHNFHEDDVMIPKSEMYKSQMPIYIV
ncbi:hypothetical protein F4806DRAFT_209864 [Annulohypoxylon nitens]|nr:hypothetical protein F4806DRAFT_209864 [Annulohypoxylon nitens]